MKLVKATLLATTALAFAACKKDKEEAPAPTPTPTTADISVRFQFMHGSNAFDINSNYTDGAGHAVRFSKLKFYASDFHLVNDEHDTVAMFHDKAVLADAATPLASYSLGSMSPGHVHMVLMNLGLDSELNHADPTLAAYPLNVADMHWSWNPAAGYKFLAMEGHADGNGDGDFEDAEDVSFTYHCATDALLRNAAFHHHADVAACNSYVLVGKVDVQVLLSGLNLLASPVQMGAQPGNITAMDSLVVAIDEL
jgi:hypothetical protein